MRTKRMLRRGLTALAAALAMMTALAAPAFAYAGDSADSTAETAAQQSSDSQAAVQTEKIGTVTTNGGRLNLRDGASTSYNIIGQLPCGDTVTVIGEENGWYKVIVPEKEGYVYGGYLKVSEGTVITGDNADTNSTGSTGDTDSGAPLTPDGNLELVDDVYQTSDGKQFITVQSKNDNTFYIVIDRDKNGENVYFLNLVDEADLMALMQDGEVTVKCTCTDRCEAGDVDLNCPVCKTTDTGVDYTIYDKASMKEIDGGQLDMEISTLAESALEICNSHGIGQNAPLQVADIGILDELQTAQDAAISIEPPVQENPEPETDIPPDPAISVEARNAYGYTDDAMLPLTKERAMELFERDVPVYLLYGDNTEAMAFEQTEILNHDGIFGIYRADWEAVKEQFPVITENRWQKAFQQNSADSYCIYQLRRDSELAELRFMNSQYLREHGLEPAYDHYEPVYSGSLPSDGSTEARLDDLYMKFNTAHPQDFTGHSLSVSDIVVLKQQGAVSSHYVDSVGFVQLPAFLPDNYLKNAEMSMEDDYGMRSLTEEYREDAIREVLAGRRIHNPRKRRSPLAVQKAQLVSALEAMQNQGRGCYYDLSIQNQITKQQARALLYYQQHGFTSADDFEAFAESVEAVKQRRDALSAQITSAEKRLNEIAVLQKHITNYLKTKDIYAGYRASGYSKAYYEEHEDAIKLCKASKRAFDELLPSDTSGKTAGSHKKQLPSLKALRAEYAELLAMKKAAYPEYYRAKDEYRELLTYQANLAGLFGIENVRSTPQREHQQEEK